MSAPRLAAASVGASPAVPTMAAITMLASAACGLQQAGLPGGHFNARAGQEIAQRHILAFVCGDCQLCPVRLCLFRQSSIFPRTGQCDHIETIRLIKMRQDIQRIRADGACRTQDGICVWQKSCVVVPLCHTRLQAAFFPHKCLSSRIEIRPFRCQMA